MTTGSMEHYRAPCRTADENFVRLGDVCSLRAEPVSPADHPELRYVGLEHIDSGDPRLVRWGQPSEVTSAKAKFHPGDVLYGKLRPYLDKAVLAPFDGICSTDILVITAGPSLCSGFLTFLAHTGRFITHAVSTTSGVNHPRTSWSALADFVFRLPSGSEQRSIASALDTIQDTRATRKREIALERERKAALMHHLFTHGTRGEPRKQTEIGEMPEIWWLTTIGEVARIVSGGTPDRSRSDLWNGGIPWVKTGEIAYRTIFGTSETISHLGLERSSARMIPAGTVLMAMYGQGVTRGRVAILGIEAAINQACAALAASTDVLPRFLFHYLAFSYDRIRNLGHGANQQNLNADLIRSISLPVPSLREQSDIANLLEACDRTINAIEREAELLDELFSAMLNELMTGRLSALPLLTEL